MRIRYDADCTTAHLEGRISVELLDYLDRVLSFYEPGFRYAWAYKTHRWDGKTHLLDRKHSEFPVGLVHRVVPALQDLGHDAELVDERPAPWGDTLPQVPTLRSLPGHPPFAWYQDQRDALETFFPEPRGCLCLPTGSGKTEIAAGIAKAVAPGRVLAIMDRKALVQQTVERYEARLGEHVGMLGGGFKDPYGRRVTCATIQTLWTHRKRYERDFFPSIKAVIVDECHRISPKTWFQILGAIPAPVRVGFSATIKEASRRQIVESYLGPILFETDVQSLIASGRAAQPDVAMLTSGGLLDDSLELDDAYWKGIVRNTSRNNAAVEIIRRCIKQGWPFLGLMVRIEHGQRLRDALAATGCHVPFLYGETPVEVVAQAKRDLEAGVIPGFLASTIFDLGHDVPAIRALVLAGGQRSPLLTIQRVGRALRAKLTGENAVHVFDFYDIGHHILRNQAEQRRKTYVGKYGAEHVRIVSSLDDVVAA